MILIRLVATLIVLVLLVFIFAMCRLSSKISRKEESEYFRSLNDNE